MTLSIDITPVHPAVLRPWQAAAYLSISRSAFYELTKRNEITLIKLGGRASGVMRTDLDSWIATRRKAAC
jgi:excisionase family DNA binding protein